MDDRLLVLRMIAWMEEHLTESGLGQDLIRVSGYSENRLRQKFYNVTGETPAAYLRKRRLTEAAKDIMAGSALSDVAADWGYSSQDNFTTAFKAWFGLTPGEVQTMDRKYRTLLERMEEAPNIMEITNLKQDPLCTTLMSCVKGASDYFELPWTTPELFGFTGHAFVVNIHKDLCPSGPYVWNKDQFFSALRNLGIRRSETICLTRQSSPQELAGAEEKIKAHLDAGKLCFLDYLEHQLICGYDSKGFVFLQPWNCSSPSELASLEYGTNNQALTAEGWVQFTFVEKDEVLADRTALLQGSLSMALRLASHPEDFRTEGYELGDRAWQNWMDSVESGKGTSHGHWWNGMVWAECRRMAGHFFEALSPELAGSAAGICRDLSGLYGQTADDLDQIKEKHCPKADQLAGLSRCRNRDRQCTDLVKELIVAL